jgi:ankyrin repeat protein
MNLDILGYIGYAILIILAVTWTIGVRVKLGASIFVIVGALFFLSSAIIVGISGVNKLHSWWIVPSGFIFMLLIARVYVFLKFHIPILSRLINLIASIFANIVRIGISSEKIRDAQRRDAYEAVYGSTDDAKFIQAVKDGDLQTVQGLLTIGVEVNAKDYDGKMALGWAAYKGHTEIIKLLLEKGADVNAKTNKGVTALMLAVEQNHMEIAKILLTKNVDINAKTIDNGQTALMTAAAESGHAAVVRLLLENGAEVNIKNNKGATALMAASLQGYTEIVKILLGKGADVNAKINNGLTALEAAKRNGHTDVIQLLEKAGAKE